MGDINFFVSVLFLLLLCFKYTSVIIAVSNNMIFYHEVKKLETFLFSLENNSELKQLRRRPRRRLQKNNRFNDQNDSSARCITLLSTFLWCPLHDYEVKPPTHLTHYGGRGHTTTNFPSPFRTSIKSSRIQIQENSPAFDILSGSK